MRVKPPMKSKNDLQLYSKELSEYRKIYHKPSLSPCNLDTRLFPISEYLDFSKMLMESREDSMSDICINSNLDIKRLLIENEKDKICFHEALIKTYPTNVIIRNFRKWFDANIEPELKDIKLSDIMEYNDNISEFKDNMDDRIGDICHIQEYSDENYSDDCDIVTFYIPFYKEKPNYVDNILKKLSDSLYSCGYNISNCEQIEISDRYSKRNDIGLAYITFEPKFSNQKFNFSEYLYHVTPISSLKKINQRGLIPRSEHGFFKYPDRVYLFNDYFIEGIIDYGIDKAMKNNQHEIAVLKIKYDNLENDDKFKSGKMKFYVDKKYMSMNATKPIAIYTYNNVDRRFIENEIVIVTFENGIISNKRKDKLSDY